MPSVPSRDDCKSDVAWQSEKICVWKLFTPLSGLCSQVDWTVRFLFYIHCKMETLNDTVASYLHRSTVYLSSKALTEWNTKHETRNAAMILQIRKSIGAVQYPQELDRTGIRRVWTGLMFKEYHYYFRDKYRHLRAPSQDVGSDALFISIACTCIDL